MAAISDKITKTMKEQNPNPTTVSTQRAAGATELQAQNLDGWPDETAVHFMTYKVDTQGQVVAGSKVDWKGVVNRNSNKIINLERQAGAADQGNSVNDIVQAGPTASWANDYAEALLKLHDTNGNLKSGAVPFTALDLGTEYQAQAALVDFNDTKFLKPSKWVFTSKDNVTRSTNRPCDDAGWLTVQLLDTTKIPGSHQGGFILQQYIDTDGRVYSRTVNSKNSSEAVYGKWQKLAGVPEKHKKDAHGWIKRELDGGAIEYSMNSGTHNIAITAANAFARDIKIPLPQGLKYDGEKMTANISVSANDPALRIEASVANGDGNITMCRSNSYNMTIHNTKLIINAILRVYPE